MEWVGGLCPAAPLLCPSHCLVLYSFPDPPLVKSVYFKTNSQF